MSMIVCDVCDRLIDSDDDPECFHTPPDYLPLTNAQRVAATVVMCEPCRESAWQKQQEQE